MITVRTLAFLVGILQLSGCSSDPPTKLISLCKEEKRLVKVILTERKVGNKKAADAAIEEYKRVCHDIDRYHPELVYRAEQKL